MKGRHARYSNMQHRETKWSKVEQRGAKCSKLEKCGAKWSQVQQREAHGAAWSNVQQSGANCGKVKQSGATWRKVQQRGAKWSIVKQLEGMCNNVQKRGTVRQRGTMCNSAKQFKKNSTVIFGPESFPIASQAIVYTWWPLVPQLSSLKGVHVAAQLLVPGVLEQSCSPPYTISPSLSLSLLAPIFLVVLQCSSSISAKKVVCRVVFFFFFQLRIIFYLHLPFSGNRYQLPWLSKVFLTFVSVTTSVYIHPQICESPRLVKS